MTISLAAHCHPPSPPTVIRLAHTLGGVSRALPPQEARGECGGGLYWRSLANRVDAAVLGAAPRRQPRLVPRRRAAKRRRRRALPCNAQPPGVVAEFAAEDCRHRSQGLWAFETANPNCWESGKKCMELSATDVPRLQEMKLRDGLPVTRAQRAAASVGWQLSAEGCEETDCGYPSAGVAIAVRSHLGMAVPPIRLGDPPRGIGAMPDGLGRYAQVGYSS